jgi:hypothetical protein
MKCLVKIEESRWVPGSNTKMIHKDEQGKLFLGPPISVAHGEKLRLTALFAVRPSGLPRCSFGALRKHAKRWMKLLLNQILARERL